MKIKKIPEKTFRYVYSKAPRLCVDIVLKQEQGILLSKRLIPPSKGKWHFPGGTVLRGEKLEDTAKRVAKEEMGVEINIKENLGVIEYFGESTFGGHAVSIVFLVEVVSGKIIGSYQAEEIEFFKTIPHPIILQAEEFLRMKFGMS
ncbi:MAG: NUDIX domain-containing protein [Patescibacteria group bacterium]|nr:NUDIX domain-containing protein [Patescibacteria group bacterium]